MIVRLLSILLLLFCLPGAALACSCACTYDYMVSDFTKKHKVFWGVPIEGKVIENKDSNWSEFIVQEEVQTKVLVYENFERGLDKFVTIHSFPELGGNCGVNINIGVPQLLTPIIDGKKLKAHECICQPPLWALIDYLETGTDHFIPNPDTCLNSKSKEVSKNCEVYSQGEKDFDARHKYIRKAYDTRRME